MSSCTLILDLFLGWDQHPISVGGSSSFRLCKRGWTSSWINISWYLLWLFLFLPNSGFFSKKSMLNLSPITQVIEKNFFPPFGLLLWNCIILQQLVTFFNASHILAVLGNTIWFHNIKKKSLLHKQNDDEPPTDMGYISITLAKLAWKDERTKTSLLHFPWTAKISSFWI